MAESFTTKIKINTDNQDGKTTVYSVLKQTGDMLIAILSLVVLSPFILIFSILIKFSGRGPVIFSQDRIGKNGKPFMIYKFRSMIHNAENGEPLLSGGKKDRVTRLGWFMRKYRIDEIPNFINVIKGDMSIVGPRPERQFFIDQIVIRNPGFKELLKVKPGITSWGQVKYGYASNVDEMLKRLEYDLYYIKNRSLWFDVKIILYTLGTILKGKGL